MAGTNMCTNVNLTPDNNGGEDVFFVIHHSDGEIVSMSIEMQSYANSASMSLDAKVFSVENLYRIIDAIDSVSAFKR